MKFPAMPNKQTAQSDHENKSRPPTSDIESPQLETTSLLTPGRPEARLNGLPPHPTNHRLRQAAVLQMQRQRGNQYVQRTLNDSQARPQLRTPGPMIQGGWFDDALDTVVDAGKSVGRGAAAVGKGIYSVGEDLVGGTYRTARGLNFFDSEEQLKIAAQNERAYNLLKDIFTNRDSIQDMVSLIADHFYSQAPKETQSKINEGIRNGAIQLAARMTVGKKIATKIAQKIATRIAASAGYKTLAQKIGVSAGVGSTGIGIPITLLMLQGTLERAGNASERLRSEDPVLFRILSSKNLDMAWFLVEDYVAEIREQVEAEAEAMAKEAEDNAPLPLEAPPTPMGIEGVPTAPEPRGDFSTPTEEPDTQIG